MTNRFLVSSVELGMLVTHKSQQDRQDLVDDIQKYQWVGDTDHPIEWDLEIVRVVLG